MHAACYASQVVPGLVQVTAFLRYFQPNSSGAFCQRLLHRIVCIDSMLDFTTIKVPTAHHLWGLFGSLARLVCHAVCVHAVCVLQLQHIDLLYAFRVCFCKGVPCSVCAEAVCFFHASSRWHAIFHMSPCRCQPLCLD
jgi:hypothetical protein